MSNNLQILSSTSFSPATCWRGSLAACGGSRARKKNKNMQNEPNFKNDQMSVSPFIKGYYEFLWLESHPKNEAKRTQF